MLIHESKSLKATKGTFKQTNQKHMLKQADSNGIYVEAYNGTFLGAMSHCKCIRYLCLHLQPSASFPSRVNKCGL